MRIDGLLIDEHVLDKIESRHGVTYDEAAERQCFSPWRAIRRWNRDLVKVFGRTASGRYLLVVIADHHDREWWIVTARDMTASERRLYGKAKHR
ncbi:MAG: BrnT family toxin [Chloroflexota bacterium]|nr:BrnT family toxin [Chloroflexota bacterium]